MIETSIGSALLNNALKSARRAGDALGDLEVAEDTLESAYVNYKRELERTTKALDNLNERKADILADEMVRFVNAFSLIKNVEFTEKHFLSFYGEKLSEPDVKQISASITNYYDFLKSGMVTLVFGGLAFGSLILNKRSKIIVNQVKTAQSVVEVKVENINTEIEKLNCMRVSAKQMNKFLRRLVKQLRIPLSRMEIIVQQKDEWSKYTSEEKTIVSATTKYVQVIKGLIDTPVITEDGLNNDTVESLLTDEKIIKLVSEEI